MRRYYSCVGLRKDILASTSHLISDKASVTPIIHNRTDETFVDSNLLIRAIASNGRSRIIPLLFHFLRASPRARQYHVARRKKDRKQEGGC